MSDSSSKSEECSRFLNDALVPSTPFGCYIIFITLASYSQITGLCGTIFAGLSALLFLLSLTATAVRYRNFFNSRISIILHIIFFLVIYSTSYLYLENKISNLISDTNYPEFISNISAEIDDIKYKRYSSEIYFSTTEYKDNKLKGILYFQGENNLNKGDIIFIHKKIYKVLLNSTNPYCSKLISQGIHFTTAASDNDITIIKKNSMSPATALQKRLLGRIDLIFKQPAAGVIKALLSGNQNYIEKSVIIQFRNSGVLHSLSASGMHVAIFAAIPAFLLIPFFRKNIAMLGSFLFVLFYLYITDMPVSLVRAVVMFGFFYMQSLLFRKRNIFNYLMLTCSIILFIAPWEIFSPGFQLSFTATAGIIIFYKQYRRSLNSIPGVIADSTAITLSAQIFTLPIIIFHMNQLNTAAAASNIIVIPLITLIMGTSMFTILVSYISIPAAVFSGYITDNIFKITLLITGFISDLKLNFYVYDITLPLIFLLLTGLIPLIHSKNINKLKFYPILFSAIVCTMYMKKNFTNNERNYIINSGKSTAEIRTENEKQILKLNLTDPADTEEIISKIKLKNPDLKIIELSENNSTGLHVSRAILNEYIIEEYRFAGIPPISSAFKKIIFQLEKDNVIVKFN